MPIEHYYGRLSEEFGGALPSVIYAEQQRLPEGFLEQVIEYRAYAAAHAANEADPGGWQASKMRKLAKRIQHELVAAELEAKEAKANGAD